MKIVRHETKNKICIDKHTIYKKEKTKYICIVYICLLHLTSADSTSAEPKGRDVRVPPAPLGMEPVVPAQGTAPPRGGGGLGAGRAALAGGDDRVTARGDRADHLVAHHTPALATRVRSRCKMINKF